MVTKKRKKLDNPPKLKQSFIPRVTHKQSEMKATLKKKVHLPNTTAEEEKDFFFQKANI